MFCMCWIHAWICPVARSHIYQTDWKTLRVLTLSYTQEQHPKSTFNSTLSATSRLTPWCQAHVVKNNLYSFRLGKWMFIAYLRFFANETSFMGLLFNFQMNPNVHGMKHFTIETWGWQYVCVAKSKSCTGARTCSQEKLATCMANLIPEDLHTELCKHNCSACMF